uniref:Uncharacterized protein n=1 Tax=Oryza nivara TaxID=4536 RepID=A0A0E0I5H6_ORYNI
MFTQSLKHTCARNSADVYESSFAILNNKQFVVVWAPSHGWYLPAPLPVLSNVILYALLIRGIFHL